MLLIFGTLAGLGLLALVMWLRSRGIAIRWYEWLIGLVGLLLLVLAIQNFYIYLEASKPRPAWMFMLTIGLPGFVMLAVSSLLVWRRNRIAGG